MTVPVLDVPPIVNFLDNAKGAKMQRKRKTTPPESLTFTNLYTQKGIYNDGKGNKFHIYISGEKKEVDRFVRYQKRKIAKGDFGIRVTVTKDDSPAASDANQVIQVEQNKKAKKVEFVSGKVMIGISRHKIVIPKPYKITYLIDPKTIEPGKTDIAAPGFQIELDGTMASILCRVKKGKVKFQLWQLGNQDKAIEAGPNAGPITLGDLDAEKTLSATANLSTVRWQVTATQAAPMIPNMVHPPSEFELEYTKHFS
jgi:hypothetical protein